MNLRQEILQSKQDDFFKKLYPRAEIEEKKTRYISAIDSFYDIYGDKEIEIFSAPGRIEICGNHTDHQRGKVIAGAIDKDMIAIVAKRDDNTIRIKSEGYDQICVDINCLDIIQEEIGTTSALVRGTAAAMSGYGYKIGGFDAYITSDVLTGSGLSSSAACEVLIANIFSGLYNDSSVDGVTIAKICQEAENKHFGKPCGLLDQLSSSLGGFVYIDFYDRGNPEVKEIAASLDKCGYSICIVNTKGSHANCTDEYAAIPLEMKKVASYFNKEVLAEVKKEDFCKNIAKIREEAGDRAVLRSMHWYSENERVEKAFEALESGDFEAFKKIIKESGDSSFKYLQNIYMNKNVDEQNISLALCLADQILKDDGASRVHGGGFAGTILAFVKNENLNEYKRRMEEVFGTDSCCTIKIRPVGGIKMISNHF